MRHRKKGFTLSRTAAARRVLARKMAISFVAHGRIQTTPARARFLQSFVEPLITVAKAGDVTARRRVASALGNRAAVASFLKRAEAYRSRQGGYTRATKLPKRRAGDGSELVILEFV